MCSYVRPATKGTKIFLFLLGGHNGDRDNKTLVKMGNVSEKPFTESIYEN